MNDFSVFDKLEEHQISFDNMAMFLDYDQETGCLLWKERNDDCYEKDIYLKRWNNFYAHQRAGTLCEQGYLIVKIFGKNRKAHRICWLLNNKQWPHGQIDHIDGDRSNNMLSNLRDVKNLDNMRNRKTNSNSTYGFRGVYWNVRACKWRAHIKDKSKNINLGYFDKFEDAVEARIKAEQDIGFHENHGRILNLKRV